MPEQNRANFYRWEDVPAEAMGGLITRRLIYSDKTMLVQYNLRAGAAVPLHHHPHEQWTQVLSGSLRFTLGDQERIVRAGDVVFVPSDAPHTAEALEETVAVEVFNPPREDFLAKGD